MFVSPARTEIGSEARFAYSPVGEVRPVGTREKQQLALIDKSSEGAVTSRTVMSVIFSQLETAAVPGGYMKAHANKVVPLGGAVFEGGASDFMNKGVNGRWRDTLSEAESHDYEKMAVEKLGPDCARWVATGELN